MAPLIPQGIINPELNLFFALLLGVGFGYILEQAGFSSARKLAGVFYGYDFVVLKVFFTAGITAMTGLLFMDYLGWIDMGLVYINPTFLYSAITGGVIMGFGFILGGYCPGTGIVAAVTGKKDAMTFVLGMLIGIFIFGHFYNAFEGLYTGHFLGNIFIYDSLGISRSWFALMLIAVALGAFIITQMIEDRVNRTSASEISSRPPYYIPSFLVLSLGIIYLLLPPEKASSYREKPAGAIWENVIAGNYQVCPQKVIHQIKRGHDGMALIDVRSREEFDAFSLPGAVNIPVEELLHRRWKEFFRDTKRDKLFFGNGGSRAMESCITASRAGYKRVFMLEGGLNRMFEELFTDKSLPDTTVYDLQARSTARFLLEAREFFLEGGLAGQLEKERQRIRAPEETEVIPVIGGC